MDRRPGVLGGTVEGSHANGDQDVEMVVLVAAETHDEGIEVNALASNAFPAERRGLEAAFELAIER